MQALLTIGAVVVVAVFGYRQRHVFSGFGNAVADANWYWVGLAFIAEVASMLPLAETGRIVLRCAGVNAPRGEMIAVTFASNAISSSLPAGAAVSQGYSYARYRHFGAAEAEAVWAGLASGAIAFSSLAGVALAGAIIDARRVAQVVIPALTVVFAGSLGAVEAFRRPYLIVRLAAWIERRFAGRVGSVAARRSARLRELVYELGDVTPPLRTWVWAFSLSAMNWLLDVACLAFAFLAFDAHIPSAAILLAFAGTKVVSSIGVVPGGIGLVEGGMVATFVAYGVNGAGAAAVVVVYRALTLVGLVGFGWVLAGVLSADERRPHKHAMLP